MSTEYENISSGPVDDDAMPTTEQLTAALNNIINPPAPSSAPGASPHTSPTPAVPIARPGAAQARTTGISVAAEIERLEASEAWAKGDPGTLARLRTLYRQQDDTPAAPALHPQQQRAQATGTKAMAEARIRQIESSKEWARGDAKVLAELKTLYQQLNPSAVPDELPHVGELRRVTGTEGPRALPSHYAENWNTDVESEYLAIGSKAGIKGEVLQAALNWYVSMGVLGGAFERGFTKEHEAEFIEAAPSMGLNDAQAQGIVQWFRSVEKDTR